MTDRKEYLREYYRKNRERILEKTSQYNRDNKEKRSAYHREWRAKNGPEWRMLRRAKTRAKQNGLDFNIEIEDVVIPDVCPIFLVQFETMNEKWSPNSPSLDRIDSSKGYVKGNIRVISARANACKSNQTIDEVERMLAYMRGQL